MVAWPRLYPVLPDKTRATVDNARDTMDSATRFAVTAACTAAASAVLLGPAGWWLLLALIPAGVSWIAYRASVHAARSYGVAVTAAFDLHRFELYQALHLPTPVDLAAECQFNTELCTHWRQGTPHPPITYPATDSKPANI